MKLGWCSLLALALVLPAATAEAADEPDPCELPAQPIPERVDWMGQGGRVTPDPLGGLLPPSAPARDPDPGAIPVSELPRGASHQSIVRSLAPLDGLRRLDLRQMKLETLGPVGRLGQVEVLLVHDTQIASLEPIGHMRTLEHVDASKTKVERLDPLAALPVLRELELADTGVTDVRPLRGLRCLERLDVSNTKVTSVRALSRLERLHTLSLAGTQVRDLRPLVRLQNLKTLSLAHSRVKNLRPLARMPWLEWIDLRGAPITIAEYERLRAALPYTGIETDVYDEMLARLEALQTRRELGESRFELAEQLWELGRRREAMEAARAARRWFKQNGDEDVDRLSAVDGWITSRAEYFRDR